MVSLFAAGRVFIGYKKKWQNDKNKKGRKSSNKAENEAFNILFLSFKNLLLLIVSFYTRFFFAFLLFKYHHPTPKSCVINGMLYRKRNEPLMDLLLGNKTHFLYNNDGLNN